MFSWSSQSRSNATEPRYWSRWISPVAPSPLAIAPASRRTSWLTGVPEVRAAEHWISTKAPWPSHPDCIGASFPPSMDTGGYRASLEELWRQKGDQIVVLSMAYHDDFPSDSAGHSPPGLARTDAAVMRRLIQAHGEIAPSR